MKQHAVLSALGKDRIGVADDLAAALARQSITIEDSRMTALGGQFALVVVVSGEEQDVTGLRRELPKLGAALGFRLKLARLGSPRRREGQEQFVIETYSSGPSDINAVTGVLKKNDINIDDLKTEASAAPWTSEITFHITAYVTIPPSCSLTHLKHELQNLERERELDIVVKPISSLAGAGSVVG